MRTPPGSRDLIRTQEKAQKQQALREQITTATARRKNAEGVLSSAFVHCSKKLLAYALLFLVASILVCLILFRRNQGQEGVLLATSEGPPPLLPSPPLLSSRAHGKEASALSFPPCYVGARNVYVQGKWHRFFEKYNLDLGRLLSRYGSLAHIFRANVLKINIDKNLLEALHQVHAAFSLEEYEAFLDVYDPDRKVGSVYLFSMIPYGSEAISYLAKNYKVNPNIIVLRLQKYQNSPLHHAAAYEDWDQFKALVDFFGDKIDFVSQDALGATAALLAIKMQRPDMAMKIFQKAPSAIFIPDNDGRTPLHYACLFGHTELAMFLIKSGANLLEPALRSPAPLELLKNTEANFQLITDVTTHVGYNVRRAENALGNGIEVCLESKGRLLANSLGRLKGYFLGVECQTTQDTPGGEPLASRANQERLKSSVFARVFSPELVGYAHTLSPLSEKSVFDVILENRNQLRERLEASNTLSIARIAP